MGCRRWTRRSTAKLAAALAREGFALSKTTVWRLLKQEPFPLQVNRKCLAASSTPTAIGSSSASPPSRAQQAQAGVPVLSVDTTKKELVGLFRQQGPARNQTSPKACGNDFPSDAKDRAVPYGIYDLQTNRGHVCVGESADTPQFAVDCIEAWWRSEGSARYPSATRLLIVGFQIVSCELDHIVPTTQSVRFSRMFVGQPGRGTEPQSLSRSSETKRPFQRRRSGLKAHPPPPNRGGGRRGGRNWGRAEARRRGRPARGGRMWILVWRSAPADRNLANEGWPTRAQTRLGACAPTNAGGLAAGRLPPPPSYHRFLPWKGPGPARRRDSSETNRTAP